MPSFLIKLWISVDFCEAACEVFGFAERQHILDIRIREFLVTFMFNNSVLVVK